MQTSVNNTIFVWGINCHLPSLKQTDDVSLNPMSLTFIRILFLYLMKEMELAHFKMITHSGHKGHCKKNCILLFSNKNELVEREWEVNLQIKTSMALTVV